MIERRCMLAKDLKFEGGLKLKQGTIVYVEETEHGAIGSFYPDATQLSAHCFALQPQDYSVMQRADTMVESLVVEPLPNEPTEEQIQNQELARKRVQHRIKAHRKEADRLEHALESGEL